MPSLLASPSPLALSLSQEVLSALLDWTQREVDRGIKIITGGQWRKWEGKGQKGVWRGEDLKEGEDEKKECG